MKKSFSLQNMELAEAAVKDAENFGIKAHIEENNGEISVAYHSPVMNQEKEDDSSPETMYSNMKNMYSEHEYQMKWMREDLAYLRQDLYKHMNKGHLPPIADAGMMKKVLKSLGLDESYDVKAPTIFVEY